MNREDIKMQDENYRSNSAFLIGYYGSAIKSLVEFLEDQENRYGGTLYARRIKLAKDILNDGEKVWISKYDKHYTDILDFSIKD